MKGALDAGLEIPHSEDILPDEEHIKGSHILKYAEILESENPDIYQKQFSKYLKLNLSPKKIPNVFLTTKEKIIKKYS